MQIQLLSEHGAAGALMEEVEMESERVWTFIIEREIEAPDRFRAIQSYRCSSHRPNLGFGLAKP